MRCVHVSSIRDVRSLVFCSVEISLDMVRRRDGRGRPILWGSSDDFGSQSYVYWNIEACFRVHCKTSRVAVFVAHSRAVSRVGMCACAVPPRVGSIYSPCERRVRFVRRGAAQPRSSGLGRRRGGGARGPRAAGAGAAGGQASRGGLGGVGVYKSGSPFFIFETPTPTHKLLRFIFYRFPL